MRGYHGILATLLIVLVLVVGCEGTGVAPTLPTLVPLSATPVPPSATPTVPAVSVATPTTVPTPMPTLTGSGGGVIACTVYYQVGDEIHVMNADGTGNRPFTQNRVDDEFPAWSPDGSQLAFCSRRGGNWDIYVAPADGGEATRLTQHRAVDLNPAWSPDGTQIAFMSERDGNQEIYVLDVREAVQNPARDTARRLTQTGRDVDDAFPTWAPDGQQIAFVSTRAGHGAIYVMNADGTDPRRLTQGDAEESTPAWSPDGQRIAFCVVQDGHWELALIDADGAELGSGNLQRLTNTSADEYDPTWSPDGTWIAFQSNVDSQWDIYALDVQEALRSEGALAESWRRVTADSANEIGPSWGP
ncbi:MAG: hypothetical protein KKA73_17510 [Chloroflexi bacterium]|nr:hypothetical protein [Chloroflexota bacterium]MBU1749485.1 hypothetical protein [Chloroflexota bacterium]